MFRQLQRMRERAAWRVNFTRYRTGRGSATQRMRYGEAALTSERAGADARFAAKADKTGERRPREDVRIRAARTRLVVFGPHAPGSGLGACLGAARTLSIG